jgi:hypothetical protein
LDKKRHAADAARAWESTQELDLLAGQAPAEAVLGKGPQTF